MQSPRQGRGRSAHRTECLHTLHQEASAKGAAMLFFPECCAFIGRSAAETVAAARPLDALLAPFAAIAQQHNLWLSLGGVQEPGPDADHIYNTHIVLNASGVPMATYRKIHLFNVDVPGGPILMERNSTAAGDALVAVDVPCIHPSARLGLSVCYDLRFPEMYQALAWDMGANVLAVPSAFTVATGKAHWELLLRARAVECQSFVVAAAQVCCCGTYMGGKRHGWAYNTHHTIISSTHTRYNKLNKHNKHLHTPYNKHNKHTIQQAQAQRTIQQAQLHTPYNKHNYTHPTTIAHDNTLRLGSTATSGKATATPWSSTRGAACCATWGAGARAWGWCAWTLRPCRRRGAGCPLQSTEAMELCGFCNRGCRMIEEGLLIVVMMLMSTLDRSLSDDDEISYTLKEHSTTLIAGAH